VGSEGPWNESWIISVALRHCWKQVYDIRTLHETNACVA
jgi:hypothetical protein